MKTPARWLAAGCFAALAAGCASRADRFYTLTSLPERPAPSAAAPTLHVILDTTVPVLDDRGELVVGADGNRILVLDHERWAAPLPDLIQQALAGDIEQRRSGVLVAARRLGGPASPTVNLRVDIVRMSAEPGRRATIEARWRLIDTPLGLDKTGGGLYDAPLSGTGYGEIARAYSVALGKLADALTADLPPP